MSSVVGFDGIPESEFFSPPYTTVRQDFAEVGRRCISVLLDRIRGESLESPRVVVPAALLVRASTARIG